MKRFSEKTTMLAVSAIMLASQLCYSGERFQTIAMQGASQTKVVNVPANEMAQIVFSFYRIPWPANSILGTPERLFQKLTIDKGGITAVFTKIGRKDLLYPFPQGTFALKRGSLSGPTMADNSINNMVMRYGVNADHMVGAGEPIIVGPATMTFASTADANATVTALHTLRFVPNPNIKNVGQ